MGLASKVQAAGAVPSAPPAPTANGPPASSQSQSSAYPQISQSSFSQPPNGLSGGQAPQRPSSTSTFSSQQSSQSQSAFPGQQNNTGRPPYPTQSSYPGQQPQQRPGQSNFQTAGFQGQQQPFQQAGFAGQPQGYQGQHLPLQQAGFSGQQQSYGAQAFGQQGQPQGLPQSQSFAQRPQPTQQSGNSNSQVALQQKIEHMIRTNRLETFYPAHKLQAVLQRLNNIDFRQLAQRWNMPLELAYDLSTLALYDIVIYADDSGSMIFEEGGERIDDLKLILSKVAEVATLFDDDGIVVRFMNSPTQGNGIRNAQEANNLVQSVQFTGMTPLGSRLDERVIRPFLAAGVQKRNLEKPILVITITDGEPVGEPNYTVSHVIKNAKALVANSTYGPGAIAFEFAQVGKDVKAQAFLGRLDNDPEIGGMIDATSYFELEAEEYAQRGVTLTPELWLVKLMVGAVDPTYDESDEL
ncbi:hypothetical protein MMC08_006312 [Hypocenomyce scalaris]|nr:hypothetical protein [Hypocenomyce scalaris]